VWSIVTLGGLFIRVPPGPPIVVSSTVRRPLQRLYADKFREMITPDFALVDRVVT
jgi:hypothetical protein